MEGFNEEKAEFLKRYQHKMSEGDIEAVTDTDCWLELAYLMAEMLWG